MHWSQHKKIILQEIRRRRLKEHSWAIQHHIQRIKKLFNQPNRPFGRHVIENYVQYFFGRVTPVIGEDDRHTKAVAQWLKRAQDATPDDGVSLGYFPCDQNSPYQGWRASYPETTGYIIDSLVHYNQIFHDPDALERAQRMAHWEAEIQMPSGAVQSGPLVPADQQQEAVFNTGMVLQGLTALLYKYPDEKLYQAANKAAQFLVNDQNERGHFTTHGPCVSRHSIKTYNALCAWAMHRFADLSGEKRYAKAAVKAITASLGEQQKNGWFNHNCLDRPEAPLTHTIGYVLQGVLETGILAKRDDFILAAKKAADAIIPQIEENGFLAGRLDHTWSPALQIVCLTGSAQMAIIFYRLHEIFNDQIYLKKADALVNYLKALQHPEHETPGIRGAIAGSYPLFGSYMTAGFPNWAGKYFLDALLLKRRKQPSP
ncbi:hypothetical protein ACQZV8_18740 [Magnetococcales bacterium HHB-1]